MFFPRKILRSNFTILSCGFSFPLSPVKMFCFPSF
jgi:hypothetical protein